MNDLPSRSVWAEALCEHEGHGVRAATVAVLVESDPESAALDPLVFTIRNADFAYGVRDFDMFVDAIWSEPDRTKVATLAAAIRDRDFDALRAECSEYAPFWCRTCRRSTAGTIGRSRRCSIRRTGRRSSR